MEEEKIMTMLEDLFSRVEALEAMSANEEEVEAAEDDEEVEASEDDGEVEASDEIAVALSEMEERHEKRMKRLEKQFSDLSKRKGGLLTEEPGGDPAVPNKPVTFNDHFTALREKGMSAKDASVQARKLAEPKAN